MVSTAQAPKSVDNLPCPRLISMFLQEVLIWRSIYSSKEQLPKGGLRRVSLIRRHIVAVPNMVPNTDA